MDIFISWEFQPSPFICPNGSLQVEDGEVCPLQIRFQQGEWLVVRTLPFLYQMFDDSWKRDITAKDELNTFLKCEENKKNNWNTTVSYNYYVTDIRLTYDIFVVPPLPLSKTRVQPCELDTFLKWLEKFTMVNIARTLGRDCLQIIGKIIGWLVQN